MRCHISSARLMHGAQRPRMRPAAKARPSALGGQEELLGAPKQAAFGLLVCGTLLLAAVQQPLVPHLEVQVVVPGLRRAGVAGEAWAGRVCFNTTAGWERSQRQLGGQGCQ